MKSLRLYLFVGMLAALALVLVAFALAPAAEARHGLLNTPTGAPVTLHALPKAGDLFPVGADKSVTFHMDDEFGYHWSDTGNCTAFSGTVTGAYPSASSSGTCTINKPSKQATSYWKAVNLQPDNCTNYSDWFEYFGSGWVTQSGTWNSYCNGQLLNSGSWSGTVGKGP